MRGLALFPPNPVNKQLLVLQVQQDTRMLSLTLEDSEHGSSHSEAHNISYSATESFFLDLRKHPVYFHHQFDFALPIKYVPVQKSCCFGWGQYFCTFHLLSNVKSQEWKSKNKSGQRDKVVVHKSKILDSKLQYVPSTILLVFFPCFSRFFFDNWLQWSLGRNLRPLYTVYLF